MEEVQKAAAAVSPDDKKKAPEPHKAEFTNHGLITIDDYKFPHAIFVFDQSQTELGFETAFNKIALHLGLIEKPDIGMTILISPQWIMVAQLTGPYCSYYGMPAYFDGFAYAGIVNMQTTIKEWPATAGLVNDELKIFECMEKSCK